MAIDRSRSVLDHGSAFAHRLSTIFLAGRPTTAASGRLLSTVRFAKVGWRSAVTRLRSYGDERLTENAADPACANQLGKRIQFFSTMKTAVYLWLILLGGVVSSLAGPEGVWGGKWDDHWPVFLDITRGDKTNTYKVRYLWLEDDGDTSFSTRKLVGKKNGQHFKANFLLFKMSGETGMLYGSFVQPRMANLVKINTGVPSVRECTNVLEKHQWKTNAIPASQALKKIKE